MPLFTPNQKAKHLGAHVGQRNRQVTVLECINADDPDDVRLQGYRYYVSYRGQVFSVPQWALRSK